MSGRVTAGTVSDAFDGWLRWRPKTYDGYRQHSVLDRKGVHANAGWQMSESVTTRSHGTYVDYDEALPRTLTREQVAEDPDRVSAGALIGDHRKRLETVRGAFKLSWQVDESNSLQFGLSYEEQSLYHPTVEPILVDFDGPGLALAVEVFSPLIDTDHRDFDAMLRYNLRVGDHDLPAGVNYGDGSVKGGNYRNRNGHKNGITERVDNSSDSPEAFWSIAGT